MRGQSSQPGGNPRQISRPTMPRHHRLFKISRSPVHGRGAFATVFIPEGTRLIQYTGERITMVEAHRRYPDSIDGEPAVHHTFLFAIDDETVVDAGVRGNTARFINHSCDPNCDAVVDNGQIWIETIRDVNPGEELAYDYQQVLEERHTPAAKRRHPCTCGSRLCRGTMLAKKRKGIRDQGPGTTRQGPA